LKEKSIRFKYVRLFYGFVVYIINDKTCI